MKVLIIDDEYLAPLELRRLLHEHSQIESRGRDSNVEYGSIKSTELPPGLFSQGVKMVFVNADIAPERLREVTATIFVGGHGNCARVVDANSFEHLFRSINAERPPSPSTNLLEGRIERGRQDGQAPLRETDQVFVSDGDRSWFVKLSEISLLESEGDYSRVHFRDNRPLILRSLKVLEQRLDPGVFFRANRHQIVNLRWIKTLECAVNGNLIACLSTGAQVEMSRRQTQKLREMRTI